MDCCAVPEKRLQENASRSSACPQCGRVGKRVDEVTLRALLTPPALERRSQNSHRFCPTPGCPVVYFGSEETFKVDDLGVPVWQKTEEDRAPICYCFGIAAADIHREVENTGRSTVEARIRDLVSRGRCACELRNPQGSCCLGNVARVVRAMKARGEPEEAPVKASRPS